MEKGMNGLQANICLLCVTLCWSTEVIIFACIPSNVEPFATTCITTFIGGALLFLAFFKRIRTELMVSKGRFIKRCLFLSALNCAYSAMYVYGLSYFNVPTGAFTISITVVVLPVILMTMRQHVGKRTWISVILVLTGIIIALSGTLSRTNVMGLIIMLAGSFIRAIFIVKLNQYAREHDPVAISGFISVFVGGISFVIWFFLQPETFAAIPWTKEVTASLFIYAYFIIAFAQTLNVFAQRRATAVGSTVIYSLEIVFSLIWGLVLPASIIEHTELTVFQILGAAFVVIGGISEILNPLSNKHSGKGVIE